MQAAGQQEIAAPDAVYTITFADHLSVRADCNMCSSSYAIEGNMVTVGNAVACTRAACPTMALETQFEQMLSGTHAATVTASTMTWTSPKGTITFKR